MHYVTATLRFKETPTPNCDRYFDELRRLGWSQALDLDTVWAKEYCAHVSTAELDAIAGKDFFEASLKSSVSCNELLLSISAYPTIPATISRE